MTEQFYEKLIIYLSPQDKKTFLEHLKKEGFKVNGFGSLDKVPNKRLANLLFTCQNRLCIVLRKYYDYGFGSEEDAYSAFSPQKAIDVWLYFLNNPNEECEEKLFGIIEKQLLQKENEKKENEKKDADSEFEKYKVALKKRFEKKYNKDTELLTKELNELKEKNSQNEERLKIFIALNQKLTNELDELTSKYNELVISNINLEGFLEEKNNKINKLTEELNKTLENAGKNGKVLVVANNLSPCYDAKINVAFSSVDFANAKGLKNKFDAIKQYDMILYIALDIPFSTECLLESKFKNKDAIKKFNNIHELIYYLERG